MTIDREAFVACELRAQHANLFRWRDEAALRADIRKSLEDTIQTRMHDRASVERYHQLCPVEGAVPNDYHLRVIDGGSDGELLAGIHFYGTDVARPFVGVVAQTKPMKDRACVMRWAERLRQAFSLFSANTMRLFQASDAVGLSFSEMPGAVVDQRMIVGHVAQLRTLPAPATPSDVRLKKLEQMVSHDRFAEAYEAFHQANPTMRARVHASTEDALNGCAAEGTLFDIEVDGQWAGIMAASRDVDGPLAGHLILEEFLDAPFRGRGLAARAQRCLIDVLPEAPGGLLFGTIDGVNHASMRTALKTGRMDVGGWTFVPLIARADCLSGCAASRRTPDVVISPGESHGQLVESVRYRLYPDVRPHRGRVDSQAYRRPCHRWANRSHRWAAQG